MARCKQCPGDVTDCPNQCYKKYCKVCTVQKRLEVCTKCDQGYELKTDRCFKTTDVCFEGCLIECDSFGICNGNYKYGLTVDHCADLCPANCLTCQKNDSNLCQKHKDCFYTSTCKVECASDCNRVAGLPTFKIGNCFCLNRCDEIFLGNFRNVPCFVGCGMGRDFSTLCTRTGDKCRNECKDGFAGEKCIAYDIFRRESREGSVQSHSIPHNTVWLIRIKQMPFCCYIFI